jgi:hypothetical protein
MLELDGRPVEMELDESGRFSTSYVMPADWVNREIKVKAIAYRQYGQRDRIVHQDRVLQSDRADMADRTLARDAITMLVYQSSVKIEIEKGSEELDFNAAQVVLRKADGTSCTVLKSNPRGPGFSVEGPSENGGLTVRYEPTSGQVNLTGLTEAELSVPDHAGRPHRQRVEFMTP